ncbi:MAG: PIN domain-containing protein [Bifidobacteriaceae bacterium]|jgi:predicted nucleic acid-binding protein|nr:PIN domain-containing protein [Bifidobacteriaceae bacterium]
MIALDASPLIGLLEPNDLHHAAATALLADTTGPLLVHAITLAEILVAPARHGREAAVAADLAAIGVSVADLGADEALDMARLRARHGLKMPDICALATAIHTGAPLVTFDVKLATVALRLGVLHPACAKP